MNKPVSNTDDTNSVTDDNQPRIKSKVIPLVKKWSHEITAAFSDRSSKVDYIVQ
jgi:hypothetical protein